MTPQEITHYSELMARFEGGEWTTYYVGGIETRVFKFPDWHITDWPEIIHEDTFGYHTSYDWLHRVWVKFMDLKFDGNAIQFSEYEGICMTIAGKITHGTIEEAFLELGRAIEWYNQIKKC